MCGSFGINGRTNSLRLFALCSAHYGLVPRFSSPFGGLRGISRSSVSGASHRRRAYADFTRTVNADQGQIFRGGGRVAPRPRALPSSPGAERGMDHSIRHFFSSDTLIVESAQ